MVYGYARVSTKGQLEGNSIEEQTDKILSRYSDAKIITESYSGAKERPAFNELLDCLKSGDTLVVTKLDRFCRTTKEGLGYIDRLRENGVNVHIMNMGLIEDTAMGRLIITNLLAFAEFERQMIIERTQSGKAIAKTKAGFKEGRPKIFTQTQLDYAMMLLKENSYRQVSDKLKMSKSTLQREKRRRKLIESS